MAPKNKAKAAGVSASSFFDLKAELSKKEEDFAKEKAAGRATALVGGVKRPDKKPTIWARQNTGVKNRAARDIELEEISKPTLDAARAVLERKAKMYEKLQKGKSGGLSEKQLEALLVDFDSKAIDHYESDSDDVDESLTVPKLPGGEEDDPIVEYEDEFGRMRTGRRSEIPRHLMPQPEGEKEEDIEYVTLCQFAEENNPLNVHYDASQEVRAKGAGFYQFSGDDETRRKQMEELRLAREETEKTRQETGAEDVRPGEVEGMHGPGEESAGPVATKSRALEKRKRELEERRKMLDAKRRKVADPVSSSASSVKAEESEARPWNGTPAGALVDPFAVLEVQLTKPKGKKKELPPPPSPIDPADAFLAQLERDMLKGGQTKTSGSSNDAL
ncbi:predicted protein [Postia placenta Mad-698-R]|nr:predicted protein [Postia placenta Mad-698-R]